MVRSPYFDVHAWVEGGKKQKSFTYISWPRMGRQKWGYSKNDGAEDFDEQNCTCTWSHCLYNCDIWLEVTVLDDLDHGLDKEDLRDKIKVRPQAIMENASSGYWQMQCSGANRFRFKVPYCEDGFRFSLEFHWESFIFKHKGREVAEVPRNALILFVEPIAKQIRPEDIFTEEELSSKVYYVDPATDFPLNLDHVRKPVLYFAPGIFAMAFDYRAYLNEEVEWIYLAPGAYVKGAFQFRGERGVWNEEASRK